MVHKWQAGDLVWVQTGWQDHLEPGHILEVGVEHEDDDDGVLVKLKVSNSRCVVAPSALSKTSDAGSRRRNRRAAVTPSPTNTSAVAESRSRDDSSKRKARDDESPEGSSSASAATPPAAKKSRRSTRRSKPSVEEESECRSSEESSKDDTALPEQDKRSSYFDKDLEPQGQKDDKAKAIRGDRKDKDVAKSARKVAAALKEQPNDSDSGSDIPLCQYIVKKKSGETSSKKKAPKKTSSTSSSRMAIVVPEASSGESNHRSEASASEEESDAEEVEDNDEPFKVEYSPSGRATCRRCDKVIRKGDLRVSHRPLFRGKPGYTVYRHLECAIFSEEVTDIQHVGGYRKLKKPDRELLKNQIQESLKELKAEEEELDADELVQKAFEGELRAAPPGLTANLLPFHVEGTSWMYHQETQVPDLRGGILSDEMGMGKTLQTIVTILDNRPKLQHSKPGAKHPAKDREERLKEEELWNKSLANWKNEMKMVNVPPKLSKSGGGRAGTLVICPVIALYQWKTEIEKFCEAKALTVGIYHGPKRASEMPRDIMCKYDIVLTTYQVLEADFRKMTSPNKVKCPNCGGAFKIDKLRVHLKYFCGEGAQRTEAQSRQRRRGERGPPRNSSKKKDPKKKSFSQTSAKKAGATKTTRKSNRVQSTGSYESDSELSIEEDTIKPVARRSRSAAVTASKRMSASAKDWKQGVVDSESDFAGNESDSSVESDGSDDEFMYSSRNNKVRHMSAKPKDLTDESESDESDAMSRVRRTQQKALNEVKKMKKKNSSKKRAPDKRSTKRGPKRFKGKGKGKANPTPDNASDESSSEEEESNRDPMAGIDMDELMKEAMEGCRASVLHSLCWWRVVLDEAHFIKSRSSQTASAAFSLTGIHRWCLSGTPLQNRVGELYSLIRFLRIDPMAHYFCRKDGCGCKSIHYRMKNGKCQDCGHAAFMHFSHFNKYVLNPIQRDGYKGDGRRAMFKLKNEVLDTCLLRRTKATRAEDMELPPRIVTIRAIRLHPIEEDFYNALYTQTRSSFDDYVQEGTLLNNYAHIFDLLTKMRQSVDHPYLIVYSKRNTDRRSSGSGLPAIDGGSSCALCDETPTERVVSSCCTSAFCRSCVVDYMSSSLSTNEETRAPCPSCRSPFSIDLNQAISEQVDDSVLTVPSEKTASGVAKASLRELSHVPSGSILRRLDLAKFATSSKIEVLVQELVQMRQLRPGSKALVFSQFVNMLDLIRWRVHADPALASMGLGVRILHGGMDVKSRDASLKEFREDGSVRVLLMSLKAGGVALNLTVASEVFLMDSWWNPAAEMQAIDRTHRLGQHRPIRAVRFIAEGTVEERVLQLQEKKRMVFDGTIGRDAGSLKMLTVDDMKSLFA